MPRGLCQCQCPLSPLPYSLGCRLKYHQTASCLVMLMTVEFSEPYLALTSRTSVNVGDPCDHPRNHMMASSHRNITMSVSSRPDMQLVAFKFEGFTVSCLCRSEGNAGQRCWTLQTDEEEDQQSLPGDTALRVMRIVSVCSP